MPTLRKAIDELNFNEYSCVVLKNNELFHANGIGVKPIIQWLAIDINFFANTLVADKIIGKAAALLLILGKAKAVYGKVMSQGAIDILTKYNIHYEYGEKVEYIANRTNTGMCPLEQSVVDIDTPNEAYVAIKQKISVLMAQK